MKVRKKPVEVEAVQWIGTNGQQIKEFCSIAEFRDDPWGLYIPTLEGDHFAAVGSWIVRGVQGEYYPCKPDIFEATYERVE